MMKKIYLVAGLAIALCGCSSFDEDELTGGNIDRELLPTPPSIDPSTKVDTLVFEQLNLDYPGLERVKHFYEKHQYAYAAAELNNYFQKRRNVENPKVNLLDVQISENEKSIADYAVNDNRFYVNNFFEDDKKMMPYSILNEKGEYNWNFRPKKASDEYPKQLHRHQWFLPLAKMYAVTKDEKYIKAWKTVYADWIKQNPQPEKPNTTSWWQLQVAIRVMDQLQLFEYFKSSKNFDAPWAAQFISMLIQQADFLEKNPYPEEGNILITQGAALAEIGTLMPELKNAEKWSEKGFSILNSQLGKQFLKDGWHRELSLHYHISMIVAYYDVMKLAVVNNITDKLPEDMLNTLEKAAEVVMNFTYPNYFLQGNNTETMVPMMNDSWMRSRRVLKEKNFRLFTEMFPDNKALKYVFTAGNGGTPEGELPSADMKLYEDAGYYILRNGWSPQSTMIVFSNNKSDNLRPYSHNQPDNGNFEFYHNGRNFFPDSGVCTYYTNGGNNDLRNWFRGIDKHNTLSIVEERNGKKVKRNINHAEGHLLMHESKAGNETIVFENLGYLNGSGLPLMTHRRAAFFVQKSEKPFLVLVDHAIGTWNGEVALSFNLCPGSDKEVVVDKDVMGSHTAFTDRNNIIVRSFTDANRQLVCEPFAGRIAYAVDGKYQNRAAYTINTVKGKDTARFITVIYPTSDAAAVKVDAKFVGTEINPAHTAVEITVDGKKYTLSYNINQ